MCRRRPGEQADTVQLGRRCEAGAGRCAHVSLDTTDATVPAEVWGSLFELIGDGKLRPAVFEPIYEGLESLPQGLEALTTRKTYGKAVVRIPGKQSKL